MLQVLKNIIFKNTIPRMGDDVYEYKNIYLTCVKFEAIAVIYFYHFNPYNLTYSTDYAAQEFAEVFREKLPLQFFLYCRSCPYPPPVR